MNEKEKLLMEALDDVSQWDSRLTHEEYTTLTYTEARKKYVEKIYQKYKHIVQS